MRHSFLKTHSPKMIKALLLGGAMMSVSACMNFSGGSTAEGIGYRQARFAEISVMNEFRSCRDDALALDEQARLAGSHAKYLASAKLLEKCESTVGPEAANVAEEERMRAYALSIQNYIKGGDTVAAAKGLQMFQGKFADKDFYYDDGSSFIETMLVLTTQKEDANYAIPSNFNISRDLKTEKNRIRYWAMN